MRLVVEFNPNAYMYFIAWSDPEDGLGAFLDPDGCVDPEPKGDSPADKDNWEHWIACKVASEQSPSVYHGTYMWDSETQAKKVCSMIRARIKAGREMPDWAAKAIAAGFTPPKGWKP